MSGTEHGFVAVVPARYGSSRLPAKPMADIAGKPMVVRVLTQAALSDAEEVWVATDHHDVERAVIAAGGRVLLTRADHASGTDRLAEVVDRLGWGDERIVVNVQGDEPLLDPRLINTVARALADDPEAVMATVAHPVASVEEFFNPAAVKVVCDSQQRALYFSRAPIPWARDHFAQDRDTLPPGFEAWRHVGLYAYRAGFLRRYAQLTPSPLESIEMLEQLRVLWHGFGIHVVQLADAPPAGVDTPEDLARVQGIFAARQQAVS